MVNCKNCGAPLKLEDAYCSHCGTQNQEAIEHIKKLEKLNQDYKATKYEVLKEVKSNKNAYGAFTILIIILLANLILIPFHANTYSIARKIISNRKPTAEIKKQFDIYINEQDYERFAVYYEKYEADYRTYSEYNRFYYLVSDFLRTKEEISNYYYGKELYADSLVRACNYIKEYKDDYDRYSTNSRSEDISKEYFIKLNNEYDLYLKAFLNLNETDIESISSISESELLVLVSKRLNNEE